MSGTAGPTVDLERLGAFLRSERLVDGPVEARPIGDGHSNITYLVSDGERRVVVRRGPPPPVPPGAHDMRREARLLQALHGSGVPVATVLAVDPDGDVLGVPSYAMEHVDGVVITDATPAALATPAARRGIAEALIDALAELHAVDWRARGLEDFGRPEGFNERHVRRMARLIADDEGQPAPAFAPLTAWLLEHVPAEDDASIVHADFRLGNVMLAADRPQVRAVLDWELATIGDPLVDVGYFLVAYATPDEPVNPVAELGRATLEPGYPTRDELVRRYAAATGRDVSQLDWYMTMALWKLAVLYEYGRRRHATGEGDDYYADPALVRRFLDAAHRRAGIDGGRVGSFA